MAIKLLPLVKVETVTYNAFRFGLLYQRVSDTRDADVVVNGENQYSSRLDSLMAVAAKRKIILFVQTKKTLFSQFGFVIFCN